MGRTCAHTLCEYEVLHGQYFWKSEGRLSFEVLKCIEEGWKDNCFFRMFVGVLFGDLKIVILGMVISVSDEFPVFGDDFHFFHFLHFLSLFSEDYLVCSGYLQPMYLSLMKHQDICRLVMVAHVLYMQAHIW